jgi:glycine/D-amino acid oxidase-like deaminating enzyme
VDVRDGRASGVTTDKTSYRAAKVVNCAGAWAGQVAPYAMPTRPVKGQMVCFAMPSRELLKHVVRAPEIYLIPRSDGRLLAGATLEDVGFDKRTVPETIQGLRRAALAMVPALKEARVLEDWAGLRPGNADSGLFRRDRAFSGWDFARACDGTGHGAGGRGRESGVGTESVCGGEVRAAGRVEKFRISGFEFRCRQGFVAIAPFGRGPG